MPTSNNIPLSKSTLKNGRIRWRKKVVIGGETKWYSCKQEDGETEIASKKRAWQEYTEWLAKKKAAAGVAARQEQKQAEQELPVARVQKTASSEERERQQQIAQRQQALVEIYEAIANGETEKQYIERILKDWEEKKETHRHKREHHEATARKKHAQKGIEVIKAEIAELNNYEQPENKTVYQMLEMFYQRRNADYQNKLITIDRLDTMRSHIKSIKDISTDNDTFSADWINEFYLALMASTYSPWYKKTTITTLKMVINWAWENEHIESMPRNLKSLKVKIEQKEPPVVKVDDMKRFYYWASGKPRLWFLLGLNCGMYQQDIADILKSEIDLESGTITRKRSKTSESEGVPTVTHKLFPETLELVKHFIDKDENKPLAFVNQSGSPMVHKKVLNGKRSKTDSIKLAVDRVFKITDYKKEIESEKYARFPFKNLRKTGSSILNQKFPNHAFLFLGQSPKTTAEKFYIAINKDSLNEPIDYLYQELKLNEWELLDRSKMQTKV